MSSVEEIFKNRITFTEEKSYTNTILSLNSRDCFDEFKYKSKINNPQSLNIKNTFDLMEKLAPLINYIISNLEKFKN